MTDGLGRIDRDSEADFLEFAARILPTSYSQHFQDIFGLWEANFATSGYFVEFGALGGVAASNSYGMERVGWDGVVAEPNPPLEKLLRRNRTCTISTKCVFDRTGDTVTFHAIRGKAALSTVGGFGDDDKHKETREDFVAHEVETITLNDLLDEVDAPPVIDWLSVDTEGSEAVILKAYDFGSRPVRSLCVEHNETHRDELYELLTAQGFRRKFPEFSGMDDWYVHQDLEIAERDREAQDRLLEAMKQVPPFEQNIRRRTRMLRQLTRRNGRR